MRALVRAVLREVSQGVFVCVPNECCAVDVDAQACAPLSEGITLNISLDHAHPAALKALYVLLNRPEPFVIGGVPVAAGDEAAERGVILATEPRDTGDLGVHGMPGLGEVGNDPTPWRRGVAAAPVLLDDEAAARLARLLFPGAADAAPAADLLERGFPFTTEPAR